MNPAHASLFVIPMEFLRERGDDRGCDETRRRPGASITLGEAIDARRGVVEHRAAITRRESFVSFLTVPQHGIGTRESVDREVLSNAARRSEAVDHVKVPIPVAASSSSDEGGCFRSCQP